MKKLILLFLLLPLSVVGQEINLDEYVSWLKGSYNSFELADRDTNFWDVEIRIDSIGYDNGHYWLWVEQGLPNEDPYRERLYQVFRFGDYIITKYYKVIDGQKIYLRGCDTYAKRYDGYYRGEGRTYSVCKSTYGGASYSESIFKVYKDRVESWERGYDSTGVQVWGSTKPWFIFNKITK